MTEDQKTQKVVFDKYAERKIEEIRLDLENEFATVKSASLIGAFAMAIMMKVSQEHPALFNGMVVALVNHRNEILPELHQ